MPVLRQFANDAFISYAHADNTGQWINQFRTRLSNRMIQLGIPANIWKDEKLAGNDDFSEEILKQLAGSALLISVVTPCSFSSHWCERERQRFEEFATGNGGLRIENKLRAFKVVKTPIDGRIDRELFPQTLGYEFFELGQDGRVHEFQPGTLEFENKVNDVAQDLKVMLQHMRIHLPDEPVTEKRIYLAETAESLDERRNQLRDQLADWGYLVVPTASLDKGKSYAEEVKRNMEKCLLSVHLVGGERGTIPGEEVAPIGVLQYQAALAQDIDRIVWVAGEAAHNTMIKAMDEGKQEGLDRLEGIDFEELKNVVGASLRRRLEQSVVTTKSGARAVFLVCDSRDHPYVKDAQDPDPTKALKTYLEKRGHRVWLPPVSILTKSKWRSDFRETLKLSDAVVLYWGSASEEWFRETFRSFIADRAKRASRPFLVQAIYLSRPESEPKGPYRANQSPFISIEQFSGFKPEAEGVKTLIQRLQG